MIPVFQNDHDMSYFVVDSQDRLTCTLPKGQLGTKDVGAKVAYYDMEAARLCMMNALIKERNLDVLKRLHQFLKHD